MSGFLAIPVVAACIVDRKKVLLTRRFSPLHPHLHKKWDYPGGKIEVGERPEGALVREIKEELKLTITVRNLLGVFINTYPHLDNPAIVLFFLALPEHSKDMEAVKGEGIDRFEWFHFDQISKLEEDDGLLPGISNTTVQLFRKGFIT